MRFFWFCLLLAACFSFNRFASLDVNDWSDRAEIYLGPFEPSVETVVFAGISQGMMGSTLTLALFLAPTPPPYRDLVKFTWRGKPEPPIRVMVDNYGMVWRIDERDFVKFKELAEGLTPFTYNFWSISLSWTCQPIDHLILSNTSSVPSSYSQLVVDGFVRHLKRGKLSDGLMTIPDGRTYDRLPAEIDDFLRLTYGRYRGNSFTHERYGKGDIEDKVLKALNWSG